MAPPADGEEVVLGVRAALRAELEMVGVLGTSGAVVRRMRFTGPGGPVEAPLPGAVPRRGASAVGGLSELAACQAGASAHQDATVNDRTFVLIDRSPSSDAR
jgi:hypothetical protein